MQLHQRLVSIFGRIRKDVATLLDKHAINAACRAEKYTWKDRLLNPTNTVHLFILQILNRNTALNDLPRKSHESFTGSAFCKARQRLPLRVFQRLLRSLAETLLPHPGGEQIDKEGRWLWPPNLHHGRLELLHARHPRVATALRSARQPASGLRFPSGPPAGPLSRRHGFAPRDPDLPAADPRHVPSRATASALQPGDIGLGDRGFCSYAHLALLSLKGVFGVFRIHQRKKVEFQFEEPSDSDAAATRSGRLPRWLYRLGARDHVVEWIKPKKAPEWMTASQYATLPERLVVRELRYPVGQPGFRVREVTLVTTLLDPELYPLEALAELYRQRWQAELHLRDLKTTMNMDVLKCKTVDGVLKEIHVFALVYNLVRVVLQAASRRQHMSIVRLSHVDAFRWLASANEGEALPKIVVNPDRPDRVEPRAVKRRPKEYDRMTRPRAELRRRLLEGKAVA